MIYAFFLFVFVPKSFLTKKIFLFAEINLTTRGPLYTCLVRSRKQITKFFCKKLVFSGLQAKTLNRGPRPKYEAKTLFSGNQAVLVQKYFEKEVSNNCGGIIAILVDTYRRYLQKIHFTLEIQEPDFSQKQGSNYVKLMEISGFQARIRDRREPMALYRHVSCKLICQCLFLPLLVLSVVSITKNGS